MSDDLKTFLNRIRILHCVDMREVELAMQCTGLVMDDERWRRFRANPVGFMIEGDCPTQEALWSIIERRESKGREPVKLALVEALRSIALGDGHYGAQAYEYKMTARAALRNAGLTWER